MRWQIFRKTPQGFHRVEATDADRVKSLVLGCHLRAVGEGSAVRVRVGTGLNGEMLLPTDLEALRAKDEALRAKDDALHAKDDALLAKDEALDTKDEALHRERAARIALEAEVARLRADRKPGKPPKRR